MNYFIVYTGTNRTRETFKPFERGSTSTTADKLLTKLVDSLSSYTRLDEGLYVIKDRSYFMTSFTQPSFHLMS